MIQPRIQFSLANAKQYFREHLSVGDYYSQGAKIAGEWFGQGAEKLGLRGQVNEPAFLALCEGLNPATGQKLGQRMNTVRQEGSREAVANRRIFFDFAIAPPKSVSVVALYQDDRIIALHNEAVRQTMLELEKFAETRVRKAGQNSERVTGNLVTACFRHDTSRELDPHLHTHCVVFNATFDPVENRWKGLQPAGMYRAQSFATNFYRHELCKGLRALGYGIENTVRGFEIKGVPSSVVARFSKRNQQINEETKQHLEIGSPVTNVGELRKRIAHGNRRRKLKDSTADRLRPSWAKQLTADETMALAALRSVQPQLAKPANVAGITAWADEHLFERRSVVNDYELMAEALGRGRGENFDLAALRDAIEERGYIREVGTARLTSRKVLGCELEIVVAAHDGRGRHGSLAPDYCPSQELALEQNSAVSQILRSRDFITLFRGGAGTGKSFALKEVERGLASAGRAIVVLAPQRGQVRDLEAGGLPADTLARFLQTGTLPGGAVVIVDEAGQVGGRQLRELIGLVRANGGRLILSGDTRQHGAVAASDALRAIEKHSGLKPAVLRQIRRQNPRLEMNAQERGFIRGYRAAVKAAAQGNVAESFDRLERLGCIRELGAERRGVLAEEYAFALARKEKVLVVAQTRDEVREVNEAVREKLHSAGRLGTSTSLETFQPLDLGDALKRDPRCYQPSHRVFFMRRYGRFAKGALCEVEQATERGLVLTKDGRHSTISYRCSNRFVVVKPVEMQVAPGDRLQLKFNGRSAEGHPFCNGELVTVRRVRRNGAIVVDSEGGPCKTLGLSQRIFVRGFAVTSYGSQGKTVDTVLLADAGSAAATNANQWYVSITRGRKRVVVFTSDKEALRRTIQRLGDRELALEMTTKMPVAVIPELQGRALAGIERHRQHQIIMTHVQRHARDQRIAV